MIVEVYKVDTYQVFRDYEKNIYNNIYIYIHICGPASNRVYVKIMICPPQKERKLTKRSQLTKEAC